MEENIIGQIAQAERTAAERKAQATSRAAEIVAEAEKRAAEIAKKSETALRNYRDAALKDAAERAQKEYENTLQSCRADAERYANGVLEGAEQYVVGIVGRVTK